MRGPSAVDILSPPVFANAQARLPAEGTPPAQAVLDELSSSLFALQFFSGDVTSEIDVTLKALLSRFPRFFIPIPERYPAPAHPKEALLTSATKVIVPVSVPAPVTLDFHEMPFPTNTVAAFAYEPTSISRMIKGILPFTIFSYW